MSTAAEFEVGTPPELLADVAAVGRIDAVPSLLELVLDITGLGFGAVARVTEDRWVACAVLDRVGFGLAPGAELDVTTTFCSEVRGDCAPIVIDRASTDPVYRTHRTPKLYGFESYIAVPIVRRSGEIFGTICALDARPAKLSDPLTLKTVEHFAALIATQLDLEEQLGAERRAMEEMRRHDARREAVMEAVSDGFYAIDRDWRITMFNRAAENYFGMPREAVVGRNLWELFPHGLGRPYEQICRDAMEKRVVGTLEAPSGLRPGRTVELRIAPMPGEGIAVSLTDITDRRAADERQKLLINELNHRVKNTLASIQSIAGQTARRAESIDAFRDSFEGRVLALSRAHDVLTQQSWDSADLADVVEQVLAPLHPGDRLRATGPSVRLIPNQALAFALALHELATNAAKYGAWSVGAAGMVDVSWSLEAGDRLRLVWREEGGPPVVPPTRQGFGSRLLLQGLVRELAGSVDLAFPPEGARCVIEAPLEPRS